SSFPRFVRTDPAKLRQIIINLVGNAIKFTNKGQITIKLGVLALEREKDKHYLFFEIRDSGIGMDKTDMETLFKPFVQLGQHEGTGLGLAITRQYINLLGGSISVTSEPGKGSNFSFTIAFEPVAPDKIQDATPSRGGIIKIENAADYRLLIVEDQLENRLLLRNLLLPFGFQLREAANGGEGVKIFTEWRPHLIFIDRRMPGLDGLDATRQIRKLADSGNTVIVAVTAHAFKDERQQMLDAGCDAFLSKPFPADAIFDILEKHLHVSVIRAKEDSRNENGREKLNVDELSKLPSGLLLEMKDALIRLDMKLIDEMIRRVTLENAALGNTIGRYANRFDYKTILEALENALGGSR
ncbi:MAG TPA: ATP-binding protein, partial [Candidatus Wallbacteria bacterium]|nr:ATP-binding protein [Candidatus Wallbacteria bacterium]